MRKSLQMEDIETMRRECGIHDVQLRRDIRALDKGDLVRITFLTGLVRFPGETLLVRVTSRRGDTFRGKLAEKPRAAELAEFGLGWPVEFHYGQIHSVSSCAASKGALVHDG